MWFKQQSIYKTDLEPIEFNDLVNIIKSSNTLREKINYISKIEDKKERADYKIRNLPYFCWATFSQNKRLIDNFKSTNYIGFDFDGAEDVGLLKEFRDLVEKDRRTYMAFYSPSYKGLKVWFRFEEAVTKVSDYVDTFNYFEKVLAKEWDYKKYKLNFDRQVKDVSRTCFFSHDPSIFVNVTADTVSVNRIKKETKTKNAIRSESNPLTGREMYNSSDLGYQDCIRILEENGYAVRVTKEDSVEMGRVQADGNTKKTSLIVHRHIKTPNGEEGRVGVYMFSTSDKRLPASDYRASRQLPATYSPIDIMMIYKFNYDYELDNYLLDNNFDVINSTKDFNELTLPNQIKRILNSKYSFLYDKMSKELSVSIYGKPYVPMSDLIDADIKSTLAESHIKGSWRDLYKAVIVSRMAKIQNPILQIREFLEKQSEIEYDPILDLVNELDLNYDKIRVPYKYSYDETYKEMMNKLELVEDEADKLEIQMQIDDYVEEKQKQLADNYIYKNMKKWFLSAVASWIKDDTVNEIVMVLQSQTQGIGKTRFMRRLLPSFIEPKYYSDELIQNGEFGKDTILHVLGRLLINIDELNTLKGGDVEKFKSLVSAHTLSVRVPYGTTIEQTKKYTSFVGTTNEEAFLGDKTGNRRYFIIPVHSVNYQHNVNIDDCYIYAYQELKKGEKHWIESVEENNQVNREFLWDTYYEEDFVNYFDIPDGLDTKVINLSGKDIYKWIFGNDPQHQEWSRFKKTLNGLGIATKVVRDENYNQGTPTRLYQLKVKRPPKTYNPDSLVWDYLTEMYMKYTKIPF